MLINKNLLFYNKFKNCILFYKNYRIMQCFNCYKYKYIVKTCWKKYDIYIILNYNNWIYNFQNISIKYKYVNCNQNYSIWIIKCNKKNI
jgi:hypothetical protein